MRIGLGYDIHKLVEDRKLVLGGIVIPSNIGLEGHSDADVLIHAVIDAILGSVAKRDIGYHFSDKDEKYKDIDSSILLKATSKILADEGYKIINIDSNVICQNIKLSPYIDMMRQKLASVLEVSIDDISIKAKTNEKLDSMGQGRSIQAQAIVLVDKI